MRTKKPSIIDPIFIGVVLLSFAFGCLIMFKIADSINTELQTSTRVAEIDTDGRARASFVAVKDHYPGVMDNSFLLLVVVLCLGALALAFMVRVHPIFFVFFLIALVIIIFLCGVFSNIYLEAANQAELESLANELTFMTHIMWILPLVVGVIGFIMAIVLYKTWQEGT